MKRTSILSAVLLCAGLSMPVMAEEMLRDFPHPNDTHVHKVDKVASQCNCQCHQLTEAQLREIKQNHPMHSSQMRDKR